MATRGAPRALLALLLVLGVYAGNRVGEALARQAAWLARYHELGLGPLQLDLLGFLRLDLGLDLRINAAGALGGVLVAWLMARRLGR